MARKLALPAVRFGNAAHDRWAAQVAHALHTAAQNTEQLGKSVTLFTKGGAAGETTLSVTPTKPTGFSAVGSYSVIMLSWDMPTYAGHVATEVWRSSEDSFGTAVLIAETSVRVWSDSVGPAQGFYYWIRHRNGIDEANPIEGVTKYGPLNATDGTFAETAKDIDALLELLEGEISEIYFSESLVEKLNLIGSLELINSSETINHILADLEALNLEAIAQLAKDGQADLKTATVEYRAEQGYALAQTTSFALANEVEARAGEVTRIETKFDGRVDDVEANYASLVYVTSAIDAAEVSILQTANASFNSALANYASKVYVGSAIDAAEVTILQAANASFNSALAGYATEAYVVATADAAEAGAITTIDARFDENTGVYGQQIKTAVDAASAATSAAESLSAGIYDANGNLSQAFIDEVSLVAVEADGETIAAAVAAYTVNAHGSVVGLQEVAEASIAADGQTFNSRWGVKTNVNGLVGGIGLYNDGSKTSFIVDSQLFSVIDGTSGQVKQLLTTITGDPVIPDGVYMDTAFIKAANITDLVAGEVNADTVTAGLTITTPVLEGGSITGASLALNAGSYQWSLIPEAESGFPLWYGRASDVVNAANAVMAVDNTGKSYLKGLQIRNADGQIMMDIDGLNGAFIDDLSVGSIAIGQNAVTVKSFVETSAVNIAKNGSGQLSSSVHPHDGVAVGGSVLVSITYAVLRTSGGSAADYIDLTATVKDYDSGATLATDSVRVGQAYDANQTYFVPVQLFVANSTAENLQVQMSGYSGGESFTLSAKVVIDSAKR